MNDSLKGSKRYALYTALSVAALLACIISFITVPIFSRIITTASSIRESRNSIEQLQAERTAKAREGDKLKDYEPDIEKVESLFLKNNEDVLPFVVMVERLARIEGVSLKKESVKENPPPAPGISLKPRYELALQVGGPSLSVVRFVESLEKAPLKNLIRSFSMEVLSRGAQSSLNARVVILVF